jgi:hypothetical protein
MNDIPREFGLPYSFNHPQVLLDTIFAYAVTLPFFDGFTARRAPALPTQEYHLPYLGIYCLGEDDPPDGDPNHGPIAFINQLHLGFTVQMEDNDPVKLHRKLTDALMTLQYGLWSDQYLMNMLKTYNPHTGQETPFNMRMEGVARQRWEINWGATRPNNQTPWAELQYEPTVIYRTWFAPEIEDDLLQMWVEGTPLRRKVNVDGQLVPYVPRSDEVQRIITKYEFKPPIPPEPPTDFPTTPPHGPGRPDFPYAPPGPTGP